MCRSNSVLDAGRRPRVAHRAIERCRRLLGSAQSPTWAIFEVILVHFIHTHDNPVARAIERRHKIIARDDYWCVIPGCMCRGNLNGHHLEHRARGGTHHEWNLATACFGHHVWGVHKGIVEIGGFAPDLLVIRLGIHPRTGKAFAAYRNQRRISDEEAVAFLADWRQWWRDRLSQRDRFDRAPREEEQTALSEDYALAIS